MQEPVLVIWTTEFIKNDTELLGQSNGNLLKSCNVRLSDSRLKPGSRWKCFEHKTDNICVLQYGGFIRREHMAWKNNVVTEVRSGLELV